MNSLQDLSAQLEALHASALALRSLMEDLEPSAALSERRWFVGLHLARQLTEASDEARAQLVRWSNADTAPPHAPH